VYARSTTFHGRSDGVEAAIKFVANEAWPMFQGIEGCLGLSLLVDRESGLCIATSSWESEPAMRASDATVRPVRDRGRDILGGSMEMDEWEIVLMHRAQHGECCRVSWIQGDLEAMGDSMRMGVLPALEETAGFCGASLMVDRAAGLGCATTVWQTRAAMEASRTSADDLRTRTASDSTGQIVDVHEFELAFAHLHVPEMA